MPDYAGKVAVIPSYSRNLCGNCNRIRLTADGNIRNCLYSHNEFDLKDLMRSGGTEKEMKELILLWIISTSHRITININKDSKLSTKTIECSKYVTNDVEIGR